MTAAMLDAGGQLIDRAQNLVWTIFVLTAAAILLGRLLDWFRTGPTIAYPGGRKVRGRAGAAVLEVQRAGGIPPRRNLRRPRPLHDLSRTGSRGAGRAAGSESDGSRSP